jgi:hypothetical protein
VLAFQAKRIFVVRNRFVQRTNRDTEVIYFGDHSECGVISAATGSYDHAASMAEVRSDGFASLASLESFLGKICAARNARIR